MSTNFKQTMASMDRGQGLKGMHVKSAFFGSKRNLGNGRKACTSGLSKAYSENHEETRLGLEQS